MYQLDQIEDTKPHQDIENTAAKVNSENGSNTSFAVDDWENVQEIEAELDGMEDPFKDKWKNVQTNIYRKSKYREFKSYTLRPWIVKANDDLR